MAKKRHLQRLQAFFYSFYIPIESESRDDGFVHFILNATFRTAAITAKELSGTRFNPFDDAKR